MGMKKMFDNNRESTFCVYHLSTLEVFFKITFNFDRSSGSHYFVPIDHFLPHVDFLLLSFSPSVMFVNSLVDHHLPPLDHSIQE